MAAKDNHEGYAVESVAVSHLAAAQHAYSIVGAWRHAAFIYSVNHFESQTNMFFLEGPSVHFCVCYISMQVIGNDCWLGK